ncbi:hypothetical protein J437_LFUL008174 [Ladona fulva]|uniref:Mitochondrial carnitine/acylcarnitine carrier protein n=1 Tax=Ladona fulva TaxID=123851 RepID=A0A8K0KL85_LADFU|nr:hypothetical protein J437_LFUL008174 [Ladona fulva]
MSNDEAIPFKHLFSGGFGGMCSVVTGHPLDTIKVRLQCMPVPNPGEAPLYRGTWDCAKKIILQNGAKGLYKGMATPLLIVSPVYAISFFGYRLGKNIQRKSADHKHISSELFLAGAFSGLLTSVLVVPGDRVKCLLQLQQGSEGPHIYNGSIDCFRKLYKEGGISNLYKGTCATLLRDIPGNGVYFMTYELLQGLLKQADQEMPQTRLLRTIMAGGTAGICSWLVAMPFDVLKSRLQTSSDGTYSRGIRDVYLELMKKEGLKGLYRGSSPTFIRAFAANAACFIGFEESMKYVNWVFTEV